MNTDTLGLIGLIADVLILPFGTILWFIIRRAIEDISLLERNLAEYKTHVAEHYVTDNDFKSMSSALFQKLDRIEEKIDRKADK